MSGSALDGFPRHSARWLSELLPGPVPAETRANCFDCPMCKPTSPVVFNAVRCCSFVPELPNFLVGRILLDREPAARAGRTTVEARIDAGLEVRPLGLLTSDADQHLYSRVDFGRSADICCPHYLHDTGTCGIWNHREANCATWFCRFERGQTGQYFWRAATLLLNAAEKGVARWAAIQLGIDAAHIDEWGPWAGRIRAFYQRTSELADGLSWADTQEICGPDLLRHQRLLLLTWQAMNTQHFPERVRLASPPIRVANGRVWFAPYQEFDSLEAGVEQAAIAAIAGTMTAAALAEAGVSRELAQRLLDFGVLVPALDQEVATSAV